MFETQKSEALSCAYVHEHARELLTVTRAQVTHRIIFQLQHNFSSGLLIHLLITEVAGIRKWKELVILSRLPLLLLLLFFLSSFSLLFISLFFLVNFQEFLLPPKKEKKKKKVF